MDVDVYVARLRDAKLMPPVGAVGVGRRQGRDVLLIDVRVPLGHELAERTRLVLGSVPHVIREVVPSEDGRVLGVHYRHISS